MIASENFVSEAVLEAAGSVFTNKYAEGYPGRRYYGGCEYQPTWWRTWRATGPSRSLAPSMRTCSRTPVRRPTRRRTWRCCRPGDTILGLDLAHGGHLTHGHKLSFSGKLYRPTFYHVRRDTEADRLRRAGSDCGAREAEGDYRRGERLSAAVGFCAHAGRLPTRSARCTSSTWRTSRDWWRAARILRRCRTRTSRQPRRTRRCAGRARG